MTIQNDLREELKDAMRARDKLRRDVIRQVETEVAVAKSAPGFSGEVDDALYRQVIGSYSKKMEKARQEFVEAGERGRPMVDKLAFEIRYLARWLPRKLDDVATRQIVEATISEMGVADARAVGRVVGAVMKKHGDEVDGGLVNRLAKELLSV